MEKIFLEHLEDLRRVLIRSVVAIAILFPVCLWLAPELLDWLVRVSCPQGTEFNYFTPLEPLLVQLKLSLGAALFLAFPYIFWEIWRFIVPGLYRAERSFILLLVGSSWLLFLAGAAISLFLVMPMVMRFSAEMSTPWLHPQFGLQNFVTLSAFMALGFGLMFQFPIAIFLVVKTGLLQVSVLKQQRGIVLVVILVLAAVITPTADILTMLILAVPTYLLFELSLIFAGRIEPAKNEPAESVSAAAPVAPVHQSAPRRRRIRRFYR